MEPNAKLAARVLPKSLYRAMEHVFAHCGEGVALVGGTAIAGFYAAHRRSDDLDLFTRDEISQRSAVLAIKSLENIGARLSDEAHTPLFYHAVCELDGQFFTADAVLDENLFRVGSFSRIGPHLLIAELETLLAMKMATLVSRCSEKDIFDLKWLLKKHSNLGTAELVELGKSLDGGATAENILASVGGATFRKDACDFSLDPKIGKDKIFKVVMAQRDVWIQRLQTYLRNAPPPPIAVLMKEVKRKRC